ncbi:MAG: ParB/RepB/Spo0J family partition protein [Clostridia bacterium]|nr:ParB/RepB/Spo0J family partition protein [Clostridia bacterium]
MEQARRNGEAICYLDPALILPNPQQPRRGRRGEELGGLVESVREWGIIQPLTVRQTQEGGRLYYELIAGERRLRAAIVAGLTEVPCRLLEADERGSAEIAIVENLQRKDLTPFEEAYAIRVLLDRHGITQEQLAQRLSVSQSYIANKLRLLVMEEDEQEALLAASLTERHARALIRLHDKPQRARALMHVINHGYNVSQTEAYVEALLASKPKRKPPAHPMRGAMKDLRLFYNSLDRALGIMRGAGIESTCKRKVTEEGVEVTILIKKR